jgi:glycosyltransferase involved in cell wall biosynthesis
MVLKRPLVIHVIPYDAVGGVESAARSLGSGDYSGFSFHKCFIAKARRSNPLRFGDYEGCHHSENNPYNFFLALEWLHSQRPKLLIASLWRSYIILIVHKLFHPACRVVAFLHLERAVHPLDWMLAYFAVALSTEVWTDSAATLHKRLPKLWQHKAKVIPFVLNRLSPITLEAPFPRFIFWGRLTRQKGLSYALEIIAALRLQTTTLRFDIIGPDLGERSYLEQLVYQFDLGETVFFHGPRSLEEISALATDSSFYLQPSLFEGMGVSVVEAMQFGLVPIVTPVGELMHYCQDNTNSLLISPSEPLQAACRILDLLSDPRRFAMFRERAISTWSGVPTYREDILARCFDLLSS